MRRGENPSRVLDEVRQRRRGAQRDGVAGRGASHPILRSAVPRRQHFAHGRRIAYCLGITLVVLVLLLFLGQPSMAFLVAVTIPFSLLFALVLMYLTHIRSASGRLVRSTSHQSSTARSSWGKHRPPPERGDGKAGTSQTSFGSFSRALEMERPVFFSILMIVVAYLPLLSLSSIEGLLFRPMALTHGLRTRRRAAVWRSFWSRSLRASSSGTATRNGKPGPANRAAAIRPGHSTCCWLPGGLPWRRSFAC